MQLLSRPTCQLSPLFALIRALGSLPGPLAPVFCIALMFGWAASLFAVWADCKPMHVVLRCRPLHLRRLYCWRIRRASRITLSLISTSTPAWTCSTLRLRLKLKLCPSQASTVCSAR